VSVDVFYLFFVLVLGAGIVRFVIDKCFGRFMQKEVFNKRDIGVNAQLRAMYIDISTITLNVSDLSRDILDVKLKTDLMRKDIRKIVKMLENDDDEYGSVETLTG